MRKTLTRIEKLDQEFPGLADDVRKWFSQGISSEKIAVRLFERYTVSLTEAPVSSFRLRRWVPEQRLLMEKKIAAQAAFELEREREVRAAINRNSLGEMR
jgi:hypothetical protein